MTISNPHPITLPKQAVILAAGKSSRFQPFNLRHCHKSTFTLLGKSIISWTIESLIRAGISKIEIIKSPNDISFNNLISLYQKRAKITLHTQQKPLGMGNAIISALNSLNNNFILLNVQQLNIDKHLKHFLDNDPTIVPNSITLFCQKTDEPQKYGMLGLDGNRVTKIVEKPTNVKGLSDKRILGIYFLTKPFVKFMKTTPTTEYQFELSLDQYLQKEKIFAVDTPELGLSLKYVWDLFPIASYLLNQNAQNKQIISPKAKIHPTAIITGPVIIEEEAEIYEYSLIQGPCYLGKKTVIGSFCKVRKNSILEESAQIESHGEIKQSLIGCNSHIHSGFIGDSIIGENCRIGANFITANRRHDRTNIKFMIKNKLVNTNSNFMGTLIGDNVKIGIHCGTNPGVIIPSDSQIPPGTILSH